MYSFAYRPGESPEDIQRRGADGVPSRQPVRSGTLRSGGRPRADQSQSVSHKPQRSIAKSSGKVGVLKFFF